MKKLLTMVLVLSLCVLPVFMAQAEGNPAGIVQVLASVDVSFDGAPDAETAWAALSSLVYDYDQYAFDRTEVENLYKSLFAEGNFEDIADAPSSLFKSDGNGGYTLIQAAGEAATMVAVNNVADNGDGTYSVDFTAWKDVHGGYDEFACNGTIVVEEDAASVLGYKALSYASDSTAVSAFTAISADAVLDDQYDFNYAPENAADGDFATCWAYTGSDLCPALTFAAEAPETLRGMAITAGYAKNEDIFNKNCRIKAIEVTFADGMEKTFNLDEVEVFDGMRVLPFEGIVETDSVSVKVTEVYPGSKYDDVCVSEVVFF